MDVFWMHGLRVGPVHISIVRNTHLARFRERPWGGFLAWDGRRWLCSTLRIRSIYLNLDVDAR